MFYTKEIFNDIKEHAIADCPMECCGLVVDTGKELKIVKSNNLSKDPLNSFEVCAKKYLAASELGEIVSYYHSHCSASHHDDLTDLDIFVSNGHGLNAILYHVPSDSFKFSNGKQLKYIGRPFEYDKQDCLSLVEDFYKNEFNIHLPHADRDENWYVGNENRIQDDFSKYGFYEVNKDKIRHGDLLVVKYPHRRFMSHFMIYLGNDEILHHRYGAYSNIEKYSDAMKSLTKLCLRYKHVK
jgi:proteasome lid subunit RPN8/RPN11